MIDLFLSILIVLTTEAYIWLLASKARWFVIIPIALVVPLWRSQSQTFSSLGLQISAFLRSFRQWQALWIVSTALLLLFGRHILFDTHVLQRGCRYFVWCTIQQLLYQSVVCVVLRKRFANPWTAAIISGLIFAALHIPNPVLVPATFLWGMFSCILFEKCRSVFALALLQVMLSSVLLWLTPYDVDYGFRTGPSYNDKARFSDKL